mgnify:CR=1 FL=1|tara:strand:+ start:2231 stop:3151 length:921 start_codon:yes stop_codon:yes gene_type:complete
MLNTIILQDNIFKPITQIKGKLDSWLQSFIENLPNIAVALVVLLAAYFLSGFIFKITLRVSKKRMAQISVAKLVARAASIIVVMLGLFLALGALDLGQALTGLLTGAGISGLVIGLALQGTLSNTISGIVLSFRKNIRLGDWIETNGFAGEVIDINLNYFVIKSADNNTVVIPNKEILENPFKNFSLTPQMRITLECGVGYESDLVEVERITKEAVNSKYDQNKMDKEVEFYYTEFGGSSINFITRFWIDGRKGMDKLQATSNAIVGIKSAFAKADINIPFPIRTIQFDNGLSVNNQAADTAAEKE